MKKKRILVAEDHSITRRGLTNFLSSTYLDLEIEEVRNGREALNRVAESQPDLIIMDMVMPHMGGGSATREIKTSWPEIKVILLILDPQQGKHALDCGADAYLLKEGDPGELLEVVEELDLFAPDTGDPNILAAPEADGS